MPSGSAMCKYPGCNQGAQFDCVCHGEGISEQRDLCENHKNLAETICALFGWTLTVKPITEPS